MDIEFVRKLCAALNRDPWVDWEDIPASTEWLSQIYAGIEGSDNFVFVISPDSVALEICQREITHASRSRKCLIPILCRDVSDNRIQEVLARIQRIDFRDPDAFESALHRLIDALDCDPDWKQTHTR